MDLADPGSFALARYLPDGRLDSGFGAGGRALMRVGVGFDAISDLLAGGATASSRSGRPRPTGATTSRSRASPSAACPTSASTPAAR